ncbi:alpha/beta hydrolase [Dactylosporangium siamense]|uniref:alpha/beta hydrolase n=1 Tax=Dactylosporangium siamense TaxID=685454 RepID=UPI001941A881|nr:alpha/beta hydrolase fold domain-containing protein [Dactylosporangium siamense]
MTIRDLALDGPHGPVPVREYGTAASGGAHLLWVHGGGFGHGDLDMPESDRVARRLAEHGHHVLAVDYRLADGATHYPVPSDDVLTAWQWLGERPGVSRAHLGGASAGANLAVGVTVRIAAGQVPGPRPASLVLAYPTLHARQDPPDPQVCAALELTPEQVADELTGIRQMYENYLGGPVDAAPAAVVPAPSDLAALPPALVLISEYDIFRPSAEALVAARRTAGRPVWRHLEPGARHGHLNTAEPDADRSIARIASWLDGKGDSDGDGWSGGDGPPVRP